MAASMVIRRQMCSVCPYLVFPNLVVNMCKKQHGNAISNRALKVVVLKRSLVKRQMLHLATRVAVTLSGLPCITPFDCIGEPATLAQCWDKWKAVFEPGRKKAGR